MSKPTGLAVIWFGALAVWGGIVAPAWVLPGKYELSSGSEITRTVLAVAVVLLVAGWFSPRAAGFWSAGFAVGGVVAVIMAAGAGKGDLVAGLAISVLAAVGVLAVCSLRWTRMAARAGLDPWPLPSRR